MTSFHDKQYLNLIKEVLTNGTFKSNRTGINTYSTFGCQMRFNLSDGTIPLLTTKKMHWPSIIHELLWYISGSTNNNDLEKHKVRIWREWADDETGELGPLYGYQLRKWNGSVDQLQNIVNLLTNNPDSRRMVVSYWNPELLPDESLPPKENVQKGKQALAPCHYTWQVYTRKLSYEEQTRWPGKKRIASLLLTQRSADVFLGVPFNISQYGILLHMLCHLTNMVPGEFIWSGGDVHIYENHLDQIKIQLSREPFPSPKIRFARQIHNINDFVYNDFILEEYQHHEPLKGAVAV